jgi:hypothetical protein
MAGRVSKWRALVKQIKNVFVVYVSMFVESNNSFTKFKNPLILTIVTMLAISLRCKNKNRVSSVFYGCNTSLIATFCVKDNAHESIKLILAVFCTYQRLASFDASQVFNA